MAKALSDGAQYLTFIDSDDTVAPTMLEKLLVGLIENDADICYCGVNTVRGSEKTNRIHITPKQFGVVTDKIAMFKSLTIIPFWDYGLHGHSCGFMCRTKILANTDWDLSNTVLFEDVTVHFQLLGEVSRAVYIPDLLYDYHQIESSLAHISSKKEMLVYKEILWDKFLNYISRRFPEMLPDLKPLCAYDLFLMYCSNLDLKSTYGDNNEFAEKCRAGILQCMKIQGIRIYLKRTQKIRVWILKHFGIRAFRFVKKLRCK